MPLPLSSQVSPSTGHKGATSDDTIDAQLRLDTQKLLDHAVAISSAIEKAHKARWGTLEIWQPFLKDAEHLALALDKLGDGSLVQARRVHEAKQRKEDKRSPDDANYLDVRDIPAGEPCASIENGRYDALEAELSKVADYEVVTISDSLMGISASTSTPSNVRRSYFQHIAFADFPVKLYVYRHGGPHPSTARIWRTTDPLDSTRDAAALSAALATAKVHSSRAMLRDYFDKFSITGTSVAVMRALRHFLLPDETYEQRTEEKQVDERLMKYLLSSNETDPQLFYDLRQMNGRDGDKFDSFWEELGSYLQLDVGESAQSRRDVVGAAQSYASKVVSIPVLVREVAQVCCPLLLPSTTEY